MSQSQVVQLMRSLPQGPISLQVSRQETRSFNDDSISVLEVTKRSCDSLRLMILWQQVPATEHSNETVATNVGVGSGRTVMTFDITLHQSNTASLGVTVHVRVVVYTHLFTALLLYRDVQGKTRHPIVQKMLI